MAENGKIPTMAIAHQADVILVVGTPPIKKLRVSSTVLSEASKVFAALLGPNFREGQKATGCASPKEINLPDDDAEAMADMCHLLHGRSLLKFMKPSNITTIFKLATVVDKYNCAQVLHERTEVILQQHLASYSGKDLMHYGRLMVAGYLLGDGPTFRESTSRLIARVSGSYERLPKAEWIDHVPSIVFYALEAKQAAAHRKLLIDLPHLYGI